MAVMYQHPTEQQLTEYQQRTLAPDIFLALREHVTECARCAARCYEPSRSRTDYETLLAALTPAADDVPYHLARETAAAYVAELLDEIDREPVVSHLEVCTECAAMIERLRTSPSAKPTAQPPATPIVDEPRVGARARAWARSWPVSLPQKFRPLTYAALALLVVALLAAAMLLKARHSTPTDLVRPGAPHTDGNPQTPRASDTAPAQARAGESAPPNESTPPAPTPQSESAQVQGARTVLTLNDGGRQITLDDQGNVGGLERLPEQTRRLVKSALVAQQLARPAVLADLNPQPSTLLGTSGDTGLPFRLLAPLGVVLESDQPTFRWQPLAGADTYNVIVTDEGLNEVASSGPLRATTWRVARPLARGLTYSWQVTAHRNDGQAVTSPVLPAPPAKFQVLARARFEELQHVRRVYPEAHLTLGVLYAQAGLEAEAAREFQALVRANSQSDVARKLLRSAQANARRR